MKDLQLNLQELSVIEILEIEGGGFGPFGLGARILSKFSFYSERERNMVNIYWC